MRLENKDNGSFIEGHPPNGPIGTGNRRKFITFLDEDSKPFDSEMLEVFKRILKYTKFKPPIIKKELNNGS